MHITIYGNSIVAKTLVLSLAQNNNHKITWIVNSYNVVNRPIALSKSSINLFVKLNIWHLINTSYLQKINNINLGDYSKINLVLDAYKLFQEELACIINTKDLDNCLNQSLNFFMHNINKIEGSISAIEYSSSYDNKPKQNIMYTKNNIQKNIDCDFAIITQINDNYFNNSLNPNYIEYDYNHSAITAVLNSKNQHFGNAYQFFNNGEILALLPMPTLIKNNEKYESSYALIFSTHNPNQINVDNLLEHIHDKFKGISSLAIDKIIPYNDTMYQSIPIKLKIAKNLIHNNTLLIGDASHRVHPLAGQGLNLGLRDVNDLLEILDNKCTNINIKQKLIKYQAKRLIDIYKIAGITHSIYNINNHQLGESLINYSFKAINHIPFLQKIITNIAN